MCTFKSKREVLVCDVAIGRVREDVTAAFGARVRYTPVEGQGTLIEAEPDIDADQFNALTREAIAAVQASSRS
jgi:hypothetical protein